MPHFTLENEEVLSCEFEIFTQKEKGQSHRKTKVRIDWSGITQEQMMVLARNLIIYEIQTRIKKGYFHPFPEQVVINATDFVHQEMICNQQLSVPESWKSGTDKPKKMASRQDTVDTLQKMLSKLSPADLAILLSG